MFVSFLPPFFLSISLLHSFVLSLSFFLFRFRYFYIHFLVSLQFVAIDTPIHMCVGLLRTEEEKGKEKEDVGFFSFHF
jgi:hypothetical protein